jgi:hypothetical protein
MFGRLQAFNSLTGATGYLMVLRGMFKEDTKQRPTPGMGGGDSGGRGGGRGGRGGPLDESSKQALRDAWNEFMKPYLRG